MRPVVAVLCNPASGRVRHRLPEVRALCSAITGAGHRYLELDGAALHTGALPDFLDHPCNLLVVVGGDGTLHAVLGALFAPSHSALLPSVLVVPAGTTNMSALDIGVGGNPVSVLARLKQRLEQAAEAVLPATVRPVLAVRRAGAAPLCGMFFGAGIIARGVEYFTRHIRGRGITGEAASGLVVARFLGALLCGDGSGLTIPVPGQVQGLPGITVPGPYVAVLASVLDRLLLGMRPYWGTGPAPIHFTAVHARPARLWRSLVPLVCGRGATLRAADGYFSANVESLALTLDGPFVMDGQCYDGTGTTLELGVAGRIGFVRP